MPLLLCATAVLSRTDCHRPQTEIMLTSIVGGLLIEKRVPQGTILDSGAYLGWWARYYGCTDPSRKVLALEPDQVNVDEIARINRPYPNVRPMRGALGRTSALAAFNESVKFGLELYPKGRRRNERGVEEADTGQQFTIFTIDDLFASETVGLLQLDLEGHEVPAINGGWEVIARDLPLIVTEAMVHGKHAATATQLRLLSKLGYDSWLIEEIAGMRADIRNLLHIPRSRRDSLIGSEVLDLAFAARKLLPVTSSTIFDAVFPCCRLGGECCPAHRLPNGELAPRGYCCAHWQVHDYINRVIFGRQHKSNGVYSPTDAHVDLLSVTRHTWYDSNKLLFGPHATALHFWQHEYNKTRHQGIDGKGHANLRSAGFAYYSEGAVPPHEERVRQRKDDAPGKRQMPSRARSSL